MANQNWSVQMKGISGRVKLYIVAIVLFLIFLMMVFLVFSRLKSSPFFPVNQALNNNNTAESQKIIHKNPGYKILSSDPKDNVGRTVVYQDRVKVFSHNGRKDTENLGLVMCPIEKGSAIKFKCAITGHYLSSEKISNSKDKYMVISIPSENEPVKIRILYEPYEGLVIEKGFTDQTLLSIEDLNVLVDDVKNPNKGVENLGFVKNYSEGDYDRIFMKNDIVTGIFYQNKSGTDSIYDDKLNPITAVLYIRRYGGKEQISKEILHNIK